MVKEGHQSAWETDQQMITCTQQMPLQDVGEDVKSISVSFLKMGDRAIDII